MAEWGLVVPFLTDNVQFAYGVEFGMLYAEMRSGTDVVQGYHSRAIQEQVTLTANRLGWRVAEMRNHDRDNFWIRLEKT